MPHKTLALIPAYNEADRIGPVIDGARTHLPVLVVDDGSVDDTAARAEAHNVAVLRQQPNQGKGTALRAGFTRSLAEGYDAVLTLDADGQHDPAEIPKFLRAYQQHNPDLIIGARDFSQIPLIRRSANTIGRWSFSWALGEPVRDNQSGYRLLSRRMMEAVLNSQEQGFEFEVDMIVECVQHSYQLEWVPIRTIYAGEKSHINPLEHSVNWIRIVWQTRQRMRQWNADITNLSD
jgi:glycosyltransferase involved in cell wall biosynthesis